MGATWWSLYTRRSSRLVARSSGRRVLKNPASTWGKRRGNALATVKVLGNAAAERRRISIGGRLSLPRLKDQFLQKPSLLCCESHGLIQNKQRFSRRLNGSVRHRLTRFIFNQNKTLPAARLRVRFDKAKLYPFTYDANAPLFMSKNKSIRCRYDA